MLIKRNGIAVIVLVDEQLGDRFGMSGVVRFLLVLRVEELNLVIDRLG